MSLILVRRRSQNSYAAADQGRGAVFHWWLNPSHVWNGWCRCRLQNRSYWSLDALCLRGENFAEDSIHGERSDTCDGGRMITAGLGVILPTLFYGGLLAICIFLLGQLLPIVYAFVSEGL